MDQATAETIEKYQAEYNKNPKSKVFAPLADGYRKLGQFNEAIAIIKNGLKFHKDFSGGHVVLGRILEDMGQEDKALTTYLRATELDQNNILAHKLLAESYLKARNVKKALSSYKMVLFLRPTDKSSLDKIKKLESLTAEEFENDSFKVKKINYNTASDDSSPPNRLLERAVSLADAFLVRSEFEKSFKVLIEAREHFGDHPDIIKRLQLIDENIEDSNPIKKHNIESRKTVYVNENINYLNDILAQIDKRKR